MSVRLFDRAYRLRIGTLEITELQIAFEIRKGRLKNPNTMELTILNLSEKSRALLQEEGVGVILEAGYQDKFEQVFKGKIRKAEHNYAPPEWVSRFECGDGEREIRRTRIQRSWNKGTPISTIVAELAEKLGLPSGDITARLSEALGQGALTKGFVASGKAYDSLTDLFKSAKLSLSVQDEVLTAVGPKLPTTEPAVVLSPPTGLVGAPQAGEKGKIKARSLMNAGLRPGRQVALQTSNIELNGFYQIDQVIHKGDYRGADWYSDLELRTL